jgi:hypothetical protein
MQVLPQEGSLRGRLHSIQEGTEQATEERGKRKEDSDPGGGACKNSPSLGNRRY